MIIDSFLFFQELKILEIRLEYLYDVVDKFIIVEANETFAGNKKEFIFEKNKRNFQKYLKKIVYYKIKDRHKNFHELINFLKKKDNNTSSMIKNILINHNYYNKEKIHNVLDTYHRECIHLPIHEICKEGDLIILSDVDEIPDKKVIKNLRSSKYLKKPIVFKHNEFKYYINLYSNNNWIGSTINNYSDIKHKSLNLIRRDSKHRYEYKIGGYHYTSLGLEKEIINKIENWGHQEYNLKLIKKNIHKNIIHGMDIFYRFSEAKNKIVKMDDLRFYDKEMSEIIIKANLPSIDLNKNISKFYFLEYTLIQLIIYLIRIKNQPIKAFKKFINILKKF